MLDRPYPVLALRLTLQITVLLGAPYTVGISWLWNLLLQVVEMLDRLYHVLDNLALRHQLFKVETIGCTHMVVGNLQKPQPDHASKAAWFALDAQRAAQSILVCTQDLSLGCAGTVHLSSCDT